MAQLEAFAVCAGEKQRAECSALEGDLEQKIEEFFVVLNSSRSEPWKGWKNLDEIRVLVQGESHDFWKRLLTWRDPDGV